MSMTSMTRVYGLCATLLSTLGCVMGPAVPQGRSSTFDTPTPIIASFDITNWVPISTAYLVLNDGTAYVWHLDIDPGSIGFAKMVSVAYEIKVTQNQLDEMSGIVNRYRLLDKPEFKTDCVPDGAPNELGIATRGSGSKISICAPVGGRTYNGSAELDKRLKAFLEAEPKRAADGSSSSVRPIPASARPMNVDALLSKASAQANRFAPGDPRHATIVAWVASIKKCLSEQRVWRDAN